MEKQKILKTICKELNIKYTGITLSKGYDDYLDEIKTKIKSL